MSIFSVFRDIFMVQYASSSVVSIRILVPSPPLPQISVCEISQCYLLPFKTMKKRCPYTAIVHLFRREWFSLNCNISIATVSDLWVSWWLGSRIWEKKHLKLRDISEAKPLTTLKASLRTSLSAESLIISSWSSMQVLVSFIETLHVALEHG